MNYLKDLTKEELKYICTVIPFQNAIAYFKRHPKEFTKIRPGFRPVSLTEEAVIKTLYDYRNKDFIALFIIKHIDRWIKEIDEELEKAIEEGKKEELAYIEVLSQSFFAENISLYFKIKGIEKSEDYLMILGTAVEYQAVNYKRNQEEIRKLKKQQKEITDVRESLENKISEIEKKYANLKDQELDQRNKLQNKTELLNQEQEKSKWLSKEVEELENTLAKLKEDEIWKTSEMEQKIESLMANKDEQKKEIEKCIESINEYTSKLKIAEQDIETWKNRVRSREKQIFTFKRERANLCIELDESRKQIKELKEALERSLGQAQKNIESAVETVPKGYSSADAKTPLQPESMEDFDDYFIYNIESMGINAEIEGALDFIEYIEKSVFLGIPILIKRGPGINLAKCLSNTLYGGTIETGNCYTGNGEIEEIKCFLENTSDRVVCIDGVIGNCNELELIPVLEQYRNKIIILTYMYDRTLNFIPKEILSYVLFISADKFCPFLKLRDITEDPSEIKERVISYRNRSIVDKRSKKIFVEIACECGFSDDVANTMAEDIEDEKHMNEILMFTLLPYVSNVLKKNPYNLSKRLQKYTGERGTCVRKEIIMRWFG